ncbi:YbaK/EbsC family protein [Parafrigoribacterium mesophilum]|uniref:YbaK/EbsC family protein n=1 Tax=Parafrigoribacterium mesophilum TaxID=433646 RepID=UPI0031FDE2BC
MSLARFRQHSAELGITVDVREMDHTTHTAEDAAAAVGCAVGAIVKSLVFLVDSLPCLVLVSGSNRVDTAMLSAALGGPARMADAKTVKSASGYSIGGVPPFGHPVPMRTVMDQDLLTHREVWAAAGAATTVFAMDSARLAEITSAEVVQLA